MIESKVCGTCKIEKPLTGFHKNRNKAFKDGLARECKECGYKRTRKYVEANRERTKEYHRAYNKERYTNDPAYRDKKISRSKSAYEEKKESLKDDPAGLAEFKAYHRRAAKRHYEENIEAIRAKCQTPEFRARQRELFIKREYGLTLDQWDKLVGRNQNKCWICDKENHKGKNGRLVVDHCHESGKVRGALCDFCNTILGALGDTVPKIHESVARFVKYLEDAEKFDVNDL